MKYSLFSKSTVPQLSRLFAQASADNKACYLVRLSEDSTEADLNKCLTFQATTGAGYTFDEDFAGTSGICTVLAKGTNCVRTITDDSLSVSDCILTALAEGSPTHLILGGILPLCLTVGVDVILLYPDLDIKFDPDGYKTQVIVNAFSVSLANIWQEV